MAELLSKETFKEKIFDFENNKTWNFKGKNPAVIDFYADWCAPCKMLSPIIDQLSKEYNGAVDFYKVDTEAEPEIAAMFNVRSIPTILFCTLEGDPQVAMGAYPKNQLEEIIADVFGVEKDKVE